VRVLQVDSGREWRGGQNQVRLLCRELAGRAEVENHLLTAAGSVLAVRARAAGAAVVETSWRAGLSPTAFLALRRAVARLRPEVVHAHDSHALSLALWLRRARPRLVPAPYAVIAHRRVHLHVKPGSGWHRADRVIAVSQGVERMLVEDGLPERAVVVIPDGVDPDEIRTAARSVSDIRRRLGLPDAAPLAVNAGALGEDKDQCTLVRAAARARSRAPDLHWVIAGEGPLRAALDAEIRALGVGDIVHLAGYVDPVDALIAEARVFVMSSRDEGFGSVVLHAQVLGVPVVSTAAGGLTELVPADRLTPLGDPGALAAKVVDALEHPSPTALDPRFTAKSMAQSVLAQYRLFV